MSTGKHAKPSPGRRATIRLTHCACSDIYSAICLPHGASLTTLAGGGGGGGGQQIDIPHQPLYKTLCVVLEQCTNSVSTIVIKFRQGGGWGREFCRIDSMPTNEPVLRASHPALAICTPYTYRVSTTLTWASIMALSRIHTYEQTVVFVVGSDPTTRSLFVALLTRTLVVRTKLHPG